MPNIKLHNENNEIQFLSHFIGHNEKNHQKLTRVTKRL